MSQRSVQTIYCDDIRQEIGNKQTLVGVYGSSLLVREFPATLPKLCVIAKIVTAIDEPFEHCLLSFQVGDEAPGLMEIDNLSDLPADSDGLENRFITLTAVANFAPITFEGPCIIRVTATCDGEVLNGVGLRILAETQAVPLLDDGAV